MVTGLMTVAVAFCPSIQASIRASRTQQISAPLRWHSFLKLLQISGSALKEATKECFE